MDKIEVFQILGIEATKDERLLKNAYRERLAVTNPEDNQEGFKQLRAAYEEACRMVKQTEESDEEQQKKDGTPSGLWVERAAEIYANIKSRQNTALWKELFEDDCFVSLEDEENCREKLLVFLMNHFKLPTAVWKLLDEKLGIVKGAQALREHFPADFVRFIVNKCERGEDVDFEQFEGAEDAQYDLFLQYYDRCWQAMQEGSLEQAAECIRLADELHIFHPVMEICRAELYEKQGKTEEAVTHLEELYAGFSGDSMIGYNLAELLWRNSDKNADYRERAAKYYQNLKAENDSHYMSNLRLTEWYYEQGQYKEAKKCAEKVLAAGGDDAFLELLIKVNAEIEKDLEREYREIERFDKEDGENENQESENRGKQRWEIALELCWCYLQDGRTSKGIRLAVTLEKQLPPEKEAEWYGLMAKLYVEEAEYEDSILMTRSWEAALEKKLSCEEGEEKEKDSDRIRQAHIIRMQCYHNLGFQKEDIWAEAVREGEAILDGSMKDIGILLELAQLYTELGEYEKSLELADRLVNEYQVFAAYANSLEVYRRQLDAGGVVRCATQCIRNFPGFARAYEYVAKVYLDLQRPDDLEKILEDAKKNGIKSVILDAYRYQSTRKPMSTDMLNAELKNFRTDFTKQVEEGKLPFYEQGLPRLLTLVYNYPDSYMLVELAIFHRTAHHYEEAKECFEKAIALSPGNPYAYNGLSFIYKYTGEYEKALVCIKKAILYMDADMSSTIYTDMADIYMLLGDYKQALAAYRQYEKVMQERDSVSKPGTWYWDSLADALLCDGQYDEAEKIYRRAYEKDAKKCSEKLADLYLKSGQAEKLPDELNCWEGELSASKKGFISGITQFAKSECSSQISETEKAEYFCSKGWMELVFGKPKAAVKAFHRAIRNGTGKDKEGKTADAIFACILSGNDRKGAKYAARLQKFLTEEKFAEKDRYFNRGKARLQMEIFAVWYIASDKEIQALLDKEKSCGICHHCTSAVCREIEGIRVLFLLRQGKTEEAKERMCRNLEIQAADEYMLAIKHTIFGDKMN